MSAPTNEELKAKQHEQWAGFAEGYSNVVVDGMMRNVYEAFVATLVPLLKDAEAPHLVDVAGASGEPALSLAKALPQSCIVSTDLAETYLPLGEARSQAAGATNLRFEVADGENLAQFADARFDAVTCSLGLMFFPDERKGLAEFYRVLKPGGFLAATVWTDQVPMMQSAVEVAGQLDTTMAPSTLNTAMRFGDAVGLRTTITDIGFEELETKVLDITFTLPAGEPGSHAWWVDLMKTPFPLKGAIAKAAAAGREGAEEEGRSLLEAKYRSLGYFKEDGSLAASGNLCHFILAQKPAQ